VAIANQHPAERPDAYPADYEQELQLGSGERLWMRPLVPADADVLAEEFALADEDTLYMRFFNPSFALTERRLRYLTEIDYTNHLAVAVMTIDGEQSQGVAIGRYAAKSATEVEVAVVVKPEYRRRGIARLVLERLAEAATRAGFVIMSAAYLAENQAASRLLEGLGFEHVTIQDGVAEATLRLVSDPAALGSV